MHDNRCREVQFPGSSNDAFSNDVASHDAAKDVHKKCVHFRVSSDDLESLFHLVSSGTATDVQEVGGGTPVQLDDVHGGHGQPGPVHHAPDVPVQGDIVQVVVGSLNLPGVLLAPVSLVKHPLLPEVCVVVKFKLCIQADKAASVVLCKGVDFDHGSVLVLEELVQVEKDLGDRWHLLWLNSNPGGDLLCSSLAQTFNTVNGELDNGIRIACSDLLNVDTSLTAGNAAGTIHGPLVHEGNVELFPGVLALSDHD